MPDHPISFPALLDSSMLSASPCARKFFFQYCANLANTDKSPHLHAGGTLADAVKQTRMAFYHEKLDFQQSIYAGAREFFRSWGDYEDSMPSGSGKFKDFPNTFAAFLSYFKEYHPASDHIQPLIKTDGTPAVEFKFALALPISHPDTGEPLLYGGRSDLIGIYEGMKCIVDEKTTYAFSDKWAQQFNMRGQFIGYVWAAQQSGHPDLTTAVARGIAIQQSAIKHQEAILFYPQWQIDRWHAQMLMKVEFLKSQYLLYKENFDLDALQMSYGNECASFNGCEMMDLCTSENPEAWFSSYLPRNWDPLADG